VITDVGPHPAAKDLMGATGVHEDDRRPDEQESLGPVRGRCLPQREMGRHDHREETDRSPGKRQYEKACATDERENLRKVRKKRVANGEGTIRRQTF
jgi:hypothetical protein